MGRAKVSRARRGFVALVAPFVAVTAGAFAIACGVVACATSTVDHDFGTEPATDGGSFATDGPTKPTVAFGEVYGHSASALYRVDTSTKIVTQIGVFQGCTYVADIAVDADSNIYASTGSELFYVETNTAKCTRIAQGTFPNSLSFVPVGTLSPDHETLVGYQGGDYVSIDPKSGKVTKVGALGGGFESSGDLVSAKGGKTFLTVKGPGCADCLVEIDPTTGALTKNWGPIGSVDVFGLAFWAGEIYGFTNAGEVLLIDLPEAGALGATKLAIADAPAGLQFWGAGSTTSAPIGPVR